MAKVPIDFKLPPLTHKANWSLTNPEKDVLDASIFLRKTQGELYTSFMERNCIPQLARTRAMQLFNRPDAKEYLEARRRQIESLWFNVEHENIEQATKEEKVSKALEVINDTLLTKVQDSTDTNWLEYVKMVFREYVKDDEATMEAVRRYLSESCSSCRYKHFCEENTKDECPLCRYREFALKNGCEEFTFKNQLNKQNELQD